MKCYQTVNMVGAWKIWPNPVWYPPEGENEIRFQMSGFGRISQIRGLVCNFQGQIFGIRTLQKFRESGYQMEGEVSVGKKLRAFTSSKLFERPDGSLVDVAVLHIGDQAPCKEVLPPYKGWSYPSHEELAAQLDNAAALGRYQELLHDASCMEGFPGAHHAQKAARYRALATEARLKGSINEASYYERGSEEALNEYKNLPPISFMDS